MHRLFGLLAILVALMAFAVYANRPHNGFSIDQDALIALDEIHSGGPPRDGIPAIERPLFTAAGAQEAIANDAAVLGLAHAGVAKAYPIAIMNWHEIVNDRFHDEPVVVTYCPLCGSGVAYLARVDGMEVTFGVSGLLYNSDVLLYDRQTESLWSQMMSLAVSGPMQGARLEMLALSHTTWGEWQSRFPDSLLLSRKTGFNRDYDRDPYAGYQDSTGVWFPVTKRDPRFHPKARVLGVELNGRFKAYPFSELSNSGGEVSDRFAGQQLQILFDKNAQSARILDTEGRELPAIASFWFAWYAFHPETEVFQRDD